MLLESVGCRRVAKGVSYSIATAKLTLLGETLLQKSNNAIPPFKVKEPRRGNNCMTH